VLKQAGQGVGGAGLAIQGTLLIEMAGVPHSCCRWIAGIGVAVGLFAVVAISQAGRFLEAPGSAPSQADVVVVLGGESGDRAVTAARLFKESFAAHLLVTGPETAPREVRPAYMHWRTQVLAERGVPVGGERPLPHAALVLDLGAGIQGQRAQLFAGGHLAAVLEPGRVVARREDRALRDHGVHQARVLSGEVLTVVRRWRAEAAFTQGRSPDGVKQHGRRTR